MKIVAFLKKNIKNNINILLLCTILVFVVLIFRKKMREGNYDNKAKGWLQRLDGASGRERKSGIKRDRERREERERRERESGNSFANRLTTRIAAAKANHGLLAPGEANFSINRLKFDSSNSVADQSDSYAGKQPYGLGRGEVSFPVLNSELQAEPN